MNIPRIMIAAAGSGSGKTLLSCALMMLFFTGRKKRQCHQVRAGLYRSDVPSDGARRPFPESGHFFHWGETDEKPFCARGRERRPCGDGGRDGTLRRPRWNP